MSNRLKTSYEKRVLSVVGIFLGATAVAGCSENTPAPEINPDANTITLKEGAKLRKEPVVENGGNDGITNIVFTNIGEDFTLPTPDGLSEKQDEDNGVWYGVPIENFPEDYQGMLKNDNDGVVWVSSQRADITETADATNE